MWTNKLRFVATLSALLITGFLITSLVSYYVANKSLSDEINQNTLPLTSDNIYSEIQRDLLRPIFISSLMANDTFVRDWTLAGEEDPDKIIRYLKEIQKRYSTITAFFVSDRTRNYYHSTGILKQVQESDPADQWYYRVRGLKTPYEVNFDRDTADRNKLIVFINYRVFDFDGNYIGATGVGLGAEDVKQLIEVYQKRYGRRIFFVNREGEVSLHGSAFQGPTNLHERSGLAAHATRILTSPSVTLSYEQNGDTVHLNSRLVPEFDWYLLVEQTESAAESRILNTLIINLLICAGITGLVLVLANLTIGGYQKRLEHMATIDKLTGATNRQAFEVIFDYMAKSAKRRTSNTAAILIDIDLFKQVNDTYGHLAGDAVLQEVANRIRQQIRETDALCRWGGEEFFLLLADCDLQQATQIAENIRQTMKSRLIHYQRNEINITVSQGVAELLPDEELLHFFGRVDEVMYQAKAAGRDRVTPAVQTD